MYLNLPNCIRYFLVYSLMIVFIFGCGGGGGDSAATTPDPSPVPSDRLWGTAQLIETDNAGTAWEPQVAVDPSGNAVAVWYQYDGTRFNIWSNCYTASTGT